MKTPFKMKYQGNNSAFPFKESPLMTKYSVSGNKGDKIDKSQQSRVKPGTNISAWEMSEELKSGIGTGLQHLGDTIISATRVK